MAKQRRWRKAAMLALPATTLTAFAASSPAAAKPPLVQGAAAEMRVLTPLQGEVVGGSFKLDVSFRSRSAAPIVTAELWVDGVRWVRRDLEKPLAKSVLSFDVDSSTLLEGTHSIQVKVFAQDGAAATTQVEVLAAGAGSPAAAARTGAGDPEMTFRSPGNGNRVSGTVEIQIDAPDKGGVNPYVTFYVDRQFKTLKNYPPYSFTWDTTEVPNGAHTIEAMGYLESTNTTATRRIQIFVDNPGGNTVRMKDVADLRKPREGKEETSAAKLASLVSRREVQPVQRLADIAGALTARDVRAAEPTAPRIARRASALAPLASVEPDVLSAVTPSMLRSAIAAPQLASEARADVGVSPARLADIQTAALQPVQGRPVAATPLTRTPVRLSIAGPVRAIQINRGNLSPAGRPVSFVPDVRQGLQVAFDGTQIAFDVQPRVEKGLPLAPFRQIFEHTGGQVMWVPSTRVVRAVNAEREIVLSVNGGTAVVNGESVMLERAPFIERGRTIVPLSFIGKALDVKVDYDPSTGRLSILSR